MERNIEREILVSVLKMLSPGQTKGNARGGSPSLK
jgi:hypothetical protein